MSGGWEVELWATERDAVGLCEPVNWGAVHSREERKRYVG